MAQQSFSIIFRLNGLHAFVWLDGTAYQPILLSLLSRPGKTPTPCEHCSKRKPQAKLFCLCSGFCTSFSNYCISIFCLPCFNERRREESRPGIMCCKQKSHILIKGNGCTVWTVEKHCSSLIKNQLFCSFADIQPFLWGSVFVWVCRTFRQTARNKEIMSLCREDGEHIDYEWPLLIW